MLSEDDILAVYDVIARLAANKTLAFHEAAEHCRQEWMKCLRNPAHSSARLVERFLFLKEKNLLSLVTEPKLLAIEDEMRLGRWSSIVEDDLASFIEFLENRSQLYVHQYALPITAYLPSATNLKTGVRVLLSRDTIAGKRSRFLEDKDSEAHQKMNFIAERYGAVENMIKNKQYDLALDEAKKLIATLSEPEYQHSLENQAYFKYYLFSSVLIVAVLYIELGQKHFLEMNYRRAIQSFQEALLSLNVELEVVHPGRKYRTVRSAYLGLVNSMMSYARTLLDSNQLELAFSYYAQGFATFRKMPKSSIETAQIQTVWRSVVQQYFSKMSKSVSPITDTDTDKDKVVYVRQITQKHDFYLVGMANVYITYYAAFLLNCTIDVKNKGCLLQEFLHKMLAYEPEARLLSDPKLTLLLKEINTSFPSEELNSVITRLGEVDHLDNTLQTLVNAVAASLLVSQRVRIAPRVANMRADLSSLQIPVSTMASRRSSLSTSIFNAKSESTASAAKGADLFSILRNK